MGPVRRSLKLKRPRADLVWNQNGPKKRVHTVRNQVKLRGPWLDGEVQRILVVLFARRLEEAGIHAFHAAAFRYRGRNILLMSGEANRGKTMSLIEAARRGARLLSTETTLIEKKGEAVGGSQDVFLEKRPPGAERSDKPRQSDGTARFFDRLPELIVDSGKPKPIERVILPDIDGNFRVEVKPLSDPEKAYQTFHCLMNYYSLHALLSLEQPMPILETPRLRQRRLRFVRGFIPNRPFHLIRAPAPQALLDEVEKLL